MNIETDLGRDPDDLFSILWLISQGVKIYNICITPGDTDQVAIASFLRKELDLDFHILIPKGNREKRVGKTSSGGVHYKLLKKYGAPLEGSPDTFLKPFDERMLHLLSIGPLTNVLDYFSSINPYINVTIQGGFCPYSVYRPEVTLEKFEGEEYIPTFNFGGDLSAADFAHAYFKNAHYVGKNVCHTLEYDSSRIPIKSPSNRAGELFIEVSKLYFEKHKSKKFHDPLAAVLSRDRSIGRWISGVPSRLNGKYNTNCCLSELHRIENFNPKVLVDVDREKFWEYIRNI